MSTELPPNERPQASAGEPPRTSGWLAGPALGGLILIGLGAFFLLQSLGLLSWLRLPYFNWWALFLLLPLGAVAVSAWRAYQASGQQMTREVRSKAFGALILLVVFSALMWNMNWARIWPIFLIIGGLTILLGGRNAG